MSGISNNTLIVTKIVTQSLEVNDSGQNTYLTK